MGKALWNSSFGLCFVLCLLTSCKEEVKIELPAVSTYEASGIGTTSATCGGEVIDSGGGEVIAKGFVWDTKSNPSLQSFSGIIISGKGTGKFETVLTGLTRYTRHYVKAYATNKAGTTYGNEVIFTTLAEFSKVVTIQPGNIIAGSAICGGNITDDGGTAIPERGVCWSTTGNPVYYNSHTFNGGGSGEFTSSMTHLTPNTTYYVRAYARNLMGTTYGNQFSFSTPAGSGSDTIMFNSALSYGTMKDIDINWYKTIRIGTQIWMAENLKTTKYRNGDPIPEITENLQWKYLKSGAYCNFNNEPNQAKLYGRLYNWYALNDIRNLAPEGWHVATNEDWGILREYLGGNLIAGDKLKEAGINHWDAPNSKATNESGFSAVPAGFLLTGMGYLGIGSNSIWWSSTEVDVTYGSYWEISVNYSFFNQYGYNKTDGHSVRCVKNPE